MHNIKLNGIPSIMVTGAVSETVLAVSVRTRENCSFPSKRKSLLVLTVTLADNPLKIVKGWLMET